LDFIGETQIGKGEVEATDPKAMIKKCGDVIAWTSVQLVKTCDLRARRRGLPLVKAS